MKSIDLSVQKRITARDIQAVAKAGPTKLLIRKDVVLTPSARDLIRKFGIVLKTIGGTAKNSASNAKDRRNSLNQAALAYGRPKTAVDAVLAKRKRI